MSFFDVQAPQGQSKVPRPCGRQHCLYLRPEPHQQVAVRAGGQGTMAGL